MKKDNMKKILTVILSILLVIPDITVLSATNSSDSNVVNVYNATTFEQMLGSENTDIILWQDIVYTGSTPVKCNSIDLNGYNLTYQSVLTLEDGKTTLRISDSQYQKNTYASTGSAQFSKGIKIGEGTLIIESGVITVRGLAGEDGADGINRGAAGGKGNPGANGIEGIGGELIFYDGAIKIYGGKGGDGGDGARGAHGADAYYYPPAGGGQGYSGGTGGKGGNGSLGGCGIHVDTVSIFGGKIEVYGGLGGNGGRGGQGGNSHLMGGGVKTGEAGTGGSGGTASRGGSGIYAQSVSVYNGTLICNGAGPGTAGIGGSGGYKGSGIYDLAGYERGERGIDGAKIYGGGAGMRAFLNVVGGTVIAQGAEYAAGIGGDGYEYAKNGYDVTISGGLVSATGGNSAYDIGGGCFYDGTTTSYGTAGELTVTGGTLKFNTLGKATNVVNPSFTNCTVTGDGAQYYEGTYNEDGKFTVKGIIVKTESETAIGDTPVKLVATFLVSRTSDITTPAPRGYVSFKENGKEIGTAVLEYSAHTDEGIRAIAEFEWIPTVENPEFIAEYVPSAGDTYASDGQASYGKLERIAVTKNPDKILYIEDTNFVDTGMELTAYYSNNFSEIITSGWTTLYDFSEYGDKEVKISYGGKETILPITVIEKKLTNIELTKTPNKMLYIEGTNFDDTGMELTLYYDNETSEVITSGWIVEYDFSKIGMNTVIISYGEKEINMDIPVVAKTLERIAVTKEPNKVQYAIGTKFIDTGMELTLYYDNGTFETITSGWATQYDFSEIGQKKVKISYGGKETTLNVDVVAVSLERIAVTKNPNKIIYVEGTQFVSDGMELTLYYNNDTSQKVTSGWVTEYDFSETGQTEVQISYAGKKITLIVSVVAKTITKIEVVNTPNKLQYLEGEDFSTLGMKVVAYYDNNTSETITDYQVSGYTSTPGIKSITVNYQGKTATFQVKVLAKQLISIGVTKKPIRMEYIEGTEFDSSGMEVTLYYNNNTSEVIIYGWTEQYEFNHPGQGLVTVSYGGKSTTLEVKVIQKTLSRIEVTNKPNKLQYLEGEEFNALGIKVTAYYNNNTSEIITDYRVSGYTSTPGTKIITVLFEGKTATFTVEVQAKSLTRIEVSKIPAKTTYLEGKDELSVASGKIALFYDNGTSEEIDMTPTMVTGFDNSVVGKSNLTVTYEGKTTTFTVEVTAKSLTRIEVSKIPAKTTYLEGKDELSVAGGKIALFYDNGTSEEIDMTPTMVTGFDNSAVGKANLTVTYEGTTTTYEIEIIEKTLTSIAVTTKPNKLTYLEGETFNKTGMVVTAYYNNNTNAVVTDYAVEGYTSTVGTKAITVTYGGKTATFTVVVNTRVPSTLTSQHYTVTGNSISKIAAGTTVSALISGLNEGEFCKVYQGNTEVAGSASVGTGMVVKIMDGTIVKASYTIIVTGDTDGDGEISITDMIAIKAHILKKTLLSGATKIAADTDGDQDISITDFIQVKAKILGKGTITAR